MKSRRPSILIPAVVTAIFSFFGCNTMGLSLAASWRR